MSTKSVIGIIVVVGLAIGAVFFGAGGVEDGGPASVAMLDDAPLPVFSAVSGDGALSASTTGTFLTYSHSKPVFSLEYPSGLEVSQFKDDDGSQTIVFDEEGKERGFQIYIVPLDSELIFTKDDIVSEFPEIKPADIEEAITGEGNKQRVYIFWSNNPDSGKLREAWFRRGKFFYEFTSYESFDGELAAVMSTLKFPD